MKEFHYNDQNSWLSDMLLPPSTIIDCPLIYDDCSLAKNATTFAISSTSHTRFIGYCLDIFLYHFSSSSGLLSFCEFAILTKPGSTAFALILGAKSTAIVRVSAFIAAFDTE